MAVTVRQTEGIPEAYPASPAGLSAAAAALDAAAIWQRIEGWTAHRFTARSVVWTVEGCGDWLPPLAPAEITLVECWDGTGWEEASAGASHLGGLCLPNDGPWRITATVGGGDLPAAVSGAFRRLAEYSAEIGSSADGFTSVDDGGVSYERAATWAARAIQNSGAADLLRPYHRRA
ncbi:hypothetical protein LA6_001165 [Marinibacterium anthonyi]|nr:hypothetical protein LA6_001165 [Marinibacterium anthonyi]